MSFLTIRNGKIRDIDQGLEVGRSFPAYPPVADCVQEGRII